ncbi:MAG: (d)CMP kinase [Muribaculaceae bacterium]|nr:(d)CMP kinase [Muribaculaceae bacterium]MDE6321138.1 (d)CMP kinase [Muribaculaceae bacterium]
MKKIIIAIDGYSSSGKSTMAKALARQIGYRYIDSGAMYRAVTLYAMRHNFILADSTVDTQNLLSRLDDIKIDFAVTPQGQHTLLNGEDVEREIRTIEVSNHVSPIAAIPQVRYALTAMQKAFGADKGIVMDGRDIGTAVFPDAELKIFVNAPAATRAQRRFKEMREAGNNTVTYEEVLENVETRDHIDRTREVSPLRKADDAIELDNSGMTIAEQDQWLLQQYKRVVGQ